jgi:hypothetical protein
MQANNVDSAMIFAFGIREIIKMLAPLCPFTADLI